MQIFRTLFKVELHIFRMVFKVKLHIFRRMSVANHGHSDPNAVSGTPGITNELFYCAKAFFTACKSFFKSGLSGF